jgi:hypothetical protein
VYLGCRDEGRGGYGVRRAHVTEPLRQERQAATCVAARRRTQTLPHAILESERE